MPLGRSRLDLQSYYRREYRRVPQQLTHHIDIVDVDAQHTASCTAATTVWGAGLRVNRDNTHGSPPLSFDPVKRVYPVSNVFAQDDIAVVPDRLFVTIGAKYEHNDFRRRFQANAARAI